MTAIPSPRYITILALASCIVLGGGWLLRPKDIVESAPPVPSETELQQLATRAQRRSLDDTTKYFAGIAQGIDASLAYIDDVGTSGIVWDERRLLTGPLPIGRDSVRVISTAGATDAPVVARGPNLPFAVIEHDIQSARLLAARRAERQPQTGGWLVAVWRTGRERAFSAAGFRQVLQTTCQVTTIKEVVSSLPLTREMIGGGLFDVEGALLGVILPCDERVAAIATESLNGLLEHADTFEQRLLGQYGLAVGPLSNEDHDYFRHAEGLLIREVWSAYPGDIAGLRAGDVITAVDGQHVAQVDDLHPMTDISDRAIELTINRARRNLTIELPAARVVPIPRGAVADSGLVFESQTTTYPIGAVLPDSQAARSGLRPGDRLVRIDAVEPRTLAEVTRRLASRKSMPMLLEVERGPRKIALVIR